MNKEQARAIANFFLDVAKGIVIGLFGYSVFTTESLQYKFIGSVLGLIVAYVFVRMGMDYLSNVDND